MRSWLLDLAVNAFDKDLKLKQIEGWVADSGEGRWTIEAAIDEDVPAPVITLALYSRFYSRDPNSFSGACWRRCETSSAATPCASTVRKLAFARHPLVDRQAAYGA